MRHRNGDDVEVELVRVGVSGTKVAYIISSTKKATDSSVSLKPNPARAFLHYSHVSLANNDVTSSCFSTFYLWGGFIRHNRTNLLSGLVFRIFARLLYAG